MADLHVERVVMNGEAYEVTTDGNEQRWQYIHGTDSYHFATVNVYDQHTLDGHLRWRLAIQLPPVTPGQHRSQHITPAADYQSHAEALLAGAEILDTLVSNEL